MTASVLPNVGLVAGFLTAEDGWGDDFNRNMRLVDALLQALVQDKDLTAPPGSPTAGQVWIVGAGASGAWSGNATKLAVWQTGDDITDGWFFVTPKPGWKVYVLDENKDYRYNGTAWAEVVYGGGGGGSAAPSVVTPVTDATKNFAGTDAGKYWRFTNTSAKTATFNNDAGFAADMEFHVVNRAASNLTLNGNVTMLPPKGGTLVLEPGDSVTVKFTDATHADVIGSTKAAA